MIASAKSSSTISAPPSREASASLMPRDAPLSAPGMDGARQGTLADRAGSASSAAPGLQHEVRPDPLLQAQAGHQVDGSAGPPALLPPSPRELTISTTSLSVAEYSPGVSRPAISHFAQTPRVDAQPGHQVPVRQALRPRSPSPHSAGSDPSDDEMLPAVAATTAFTATAPSVA